MQKALSCIDEDLILALYERYRTDLVTLNRRMAALGFVGMFGDVEGEVVYLLIRHTRPTVVFEASPAKGWSSCYILNALADNAHGTLYSYDMVQDSNVHIPQDLQARRRFFVGDLQQSLSDIPREIDFCFMDSDHSYAFAKWYIEHIYPRVRPGAVGVVHDIYDVNLKTFDENRNGKTEIRAILDHLALARTPHFRIGHDCGFLPRLREARRRLAAESGLKVLNADNNAALFFVFGSVAG
jgi:predicted O-methyltransferase YrrM